MNIRYARFVSATSLLVMLGCGADKVVDDAKDAAVKAAFESIKNAAEANGGTAAIVDGETTIEVTDPASPIAGAKVFVPAGAIPAGVDNAAISMQGGTLPEEQADDVKTAGPGASHVGIATSATTAISATSSGGVMEHSTTDDYWGSAYVTARRIG